MGGGGEEKSSPDVGFRESHWVGNRSSGKPLSGRANFHVRPDLSHLPGFFFWRGESGTTGCKPTGGGGRGGEGEGWRERERPKEVK